MKYLIVWVLFSGDFKVGSGLLSKESCMRELAEITKVIIAYRNNNNIMKSQNDPNVLIDYGRCAENIY